jgi:opacity protein-like surface antigen
MKKSILLLLAMVALFASTATAQEKGVKYYGEVFVAGDASWANMVYSSEKVANNDVLMYGTSLHTIHGVKIGDKFSLGLGLGIDILLGMDEEDDADVGGLLIPLYLDFKLAISFLYF